MSWVTAPGLPGGALPHAVQVAWVGLTAPQPQARSYPSGLCRPEHSIPMARVMETGVAGGCVCLEERICFGGRDTEAMLAWQGREP